MSRENVEAAARLYDLYARGDIDGMLAGMDPEVEVDVSDRLPDEDVFRGREAYRSFLEAGFDVWADGTPYRVKVFADRKRALEAAGLSEGLDLWTYEPVRVLPPRRFSSYPAAEPL